MIKVKIRKTDLWILILNFLKPAPAGKQSSKLCSVKKPQFRCIICSQSKIHPSRKASWAWVSHICRYFLTQEENNYLPSFWKVFWHCWKSSSERHLIDIEMQVLPHPMVLIKKPQKTQKLYCPKCLQILLLAPASFMFLLSSKHSLGCQLESKSKAAISDFAVLYQ